FYGVAAWELTGTANYSVVANTYGYVGGGRNSSQFSYKTPDMGGLSAELGYIFKDDNAGAAKWDLNVVYANGPIAAGLSANKAKGQKVGYAIGGKYNFGNFAVAASYSDNHKLRRGFSIGGTATFGAASVTLDLTRDTKHPVKKYTNGLLEGKYALSKRTFLYAAYLRLDGNNNYGLGIRHNF
ncbi:MAG TPA: porin, partial [Ottowia sp.]|nr:porin [Ottowia sp.]